MTAEQLQEQGSLYVLGLLEGEELRAFEAQLAANPDLSRDVDQLSGTVAELAHVAPARALPANLEARILGAIRETSTGPKIPVARSATWIPWAIAACLAVACVIAVADRQRLAERVATSRAELEQSRSRIAESQSQIAALAAEKERAEQQVTALRQREADARTQMATMAAARDDAAAKLAQSRLETEAREQREQRDARQAREERAAPEPVPPPENSEPGAALANVQIATLTSKMSRARDASAALVWDGTLQRGVLNTNKVPPNDPSREYQLWIVDPRFSDPVSAGVFRVEKSGSTRYVFTPNVRIESAVAFAVSLERKGGVVKAEGPIVLAGK